MSRGPMHHEFQRQTKNLKSNERGNGEFPDNGIPVLENASSTVRTSAMAMSGAIKGGVRSHGRSRPDAAAAN